ncbi:MAG: hypothetical protein AB1414_09840 [bacterium]
MFKFLKDFIDYNRPGGLVPGVYVPELHKTTRPPDTKTPETPEYLNGYKNLNIE